MITCTTLKCFPSYKSRHPPTRPLASQATGLEEENRELKHKMEAMRSSRRIWLPTQEVRKAEKKAPKSLQRAAHRVPKNIPEVKISHLVESEQKEDLVAKLAKCSIEDVTVTSMISTVRVMNIAWVKCPLQEAMNAVANGSILVRWSSAKIQTTKSKHVRCYR
ncbi:UNVERIFIED_CONTAM: hypothetical protein PYX00_002598 [Menopon gallinae]|uniref:Uncharacterized protein n=1 Tax=Menopon gallinae TaxID=328185 RepID=A0AAW2IIX6_9NEOP